MENQTNITHAVELSYEYHTQTHNATYLHKIIEIDKKMSAILDLNMATIYFVIVFYHQYTGPK